MAMKGEGGGSKIAETFHKLLKIIYIKTQQKDRAMKLCKQFKVAPWQMHPEMQLRIGAGTNAKGNKRSRGNGGNPRLLL